MQKLNSLCFLALAVVTLVFASCASQPAGVTSTTTATTTTDSPMNRNKGNGLASYMH